MRVHVVRFVDDIARYQLETVRQFSPFRKGTVTALDTATTPNLATVQGRRMPYGVEDLEVGDLVLFGDFKDPFVLMRLVGAEEVQELQEFE